MSDEMTHQLAATAERLANAAETLDRVLGKLDAQHESLNAKVDRIVAAVEERLDEQQADEAGKPYRLQARVAELEKVNAELRAQAARVTRKTLPPMISALLGKNDMDGAERFDPAALDKTLHGLSVEQRIAVKAEMARAGMIE